MVLDQEIAPSAASDSAAAVRSAPAIDLETSSKPASSAEGIVQSLILVILFAVPALCWSRTNGIHDPDIWWHIRTGEWILEHHAIPHTDRFSGFAAGKPWQAYSWLFEVLVYKLYATFGLLGIMLYSSSLAIATTAALHHMVKRLQRDFSLVVLLTMTGALCLGHLYTPRPWLFTILFFTLEIDILMQVRRSGRLRELLWLPLIFALWANIHIQFIDGLVVLALASAEALAGLYYPALSNREGRQIHPFAIPVASVLAFLATFLNPFGPSIYKIAYELNAQTGVLNLINELKAVPFRDLTDFTLLILTLAACAMLARSRRLLAFETALFVFAAFLSFRSQRDVWVMSVVALVILASRLPGSLKAKDHTNPAVSPLAGLAALLALIATSLILHVNNTSLRTQMSTTEPVKAVNFIKQQSFVGPIYNDFNWGGYVIYHLRDLPASIDGRSVLMGQEHIDRSVATIGAQAGWSTDPELAAAGVVLLPVSAPLNSVLQLDPRFHLVYQDKVAMVFVAHQPVAPVEPGSSRSAIRSAVD